MITNLQRVSGAKPFYRFDVMAEVLGQLVPIKGFIYREGEGVKVPWVKFGSQGSKGKRRTWSSCRGQFSKLWSGWW